MSGNEAVLSIGALPGGVDGPSLLAEGELPGRARRFAYRGDCRLPLPEPQAQVVSRAWVGSHALRGPVGALGRRDVNPLRRFKRP